MKNLTRKLSLNRETLRHVVGGSTVKTKTGPAASIGCSNLIPCSAGITLCQTCHPDEQP